MYALTLDEYLYFKRHFKKRVEIDQVRQFLYSSIPV